MFCAFVWGAMLPSALIAQELRATVEINAQAATNVDPQVFQELQQAVASFLNERKWSSDNFEDFEKSSNKKAACIEEIAFKMGYIDKLQLQKIAQSMTSSEYGKYLFNL